MHTSGRRYLVRAQPERGPITSLCNLDQEKPQLRKPKLSKGIGDSGFEKEATENLQKGSQKSLDIELLL